MIGDLKIMIRLHQSPLRPSPCRPESAFWDAKRGQELKQLRLGGSGTRNTSMRRIRTARLLAPDDDHDA